MTHKYLALSGKITWRSFIIAVAAFALCLVTASESVAHPFRTDTAQQSKIANKFPDEKFTKSWNAFAQAVKTNNLKSVKTLSTECIYCTYCLYNTDKENQTFVDSMKKNADAWTYKVAAELQYLPASKFLAEDFTDIFPATVKAKLTDKASLSYRNGEANRKLFRKVCISDRPISGQQKIVEVVIAEHSAKVSLNRTFTFIEEKNGYKFCGFSTMP